MAKPVARYAIMYGLEGLYMPDSHYGAFEVHSRKDLAELIRAALADYEMPAALFREVRIRRLWSFIKRNGSSTAHFGLNYKGNVLMFSGLTEEEYALQEEQE